MNPKLQLLLALFIWGTLGIVVKYIELPTNFIVLARGVIGAFFLYGFIRLTGKAIDSQAIRRNAKLLVLSGMLIGVNWMLLFEAFHYTTIAVAILCYYMAPLFVILMAPVVLKERLTGSQVMCVGAALLGMALVSGVFDGAVSGATGIVMALGAATCYATVVLINKFVHDVGAYDSTMVQLASAAAIFVPYTLVTTDLSAVNWEMTSIVLLVAVGIIHTGIAYALYFGSFKQLPTQLISIYSYLDPVIGIVLAWIILSEPMTPIGMVGGVLILGSTYVMDRLGQK